MFELHRRTATVAGVVHSARSIHRSAETTGAQRIQGVENLRSLAVPQSGQNNGMPSVLWFRRDLRLTDLPSLLAAADGDGDVLGCFVLDPRLEASSGPRRLQYLGDSLRHLQGELDGRLLVVRGSAEKQIPLIAKDIGADAVHISGDFTPYGRRRDEQVQNALDDIPLVATGSPYLVSPGRILKDDDSPYKVFTPFFRRWNEHGWRDPATSTARSALWLDPADLSHKTLRPVQIPDPGADMDVTAGEAAALEQWKNFVEDDLQNYEEDRNRPDLARTSRMSGPLKFGTIHPRTMAADLNARRKGDAA